MKEVHVKIAGTILGILVIALLVVEQGWAISTLWGWFIVPLGAPSIGVAVAIGIAITASTIRRRYHKTPDEERYKSLAYGFIHPLLCVGIGWIAKQFV